MDNGRGIFRGLIKKNRVSHKALFWLRDHIYNPPKYSEYIFENELPDTESPYYWIYVNGKNLQASKIIIKNDKILPAQKDGIIYFTNTPKIPDYINIDIWNYIII